MASRIVAGLTALGIIAALVWTFSQPSSALVGGNSTDPAEFVATVKPGQRVCAILRSSDARADALRVTIGTFGSPSVPLRLSVDKASRAIAASSYRQGEVDFPLPTGSHGGDHEGDAKIAFAGIPLGDTESTLDGKPVKYRVSLGLIDSAPPTWGSRVSQAISRMGNGPGVPFGAATGWVVIVLAAAGLLGAVGAIARWAR